MTKINKNWPSIKRILTKEASFISSKKRSIYAIADSREILRELPNSIVNCIVTSPPYGDLKDYGSKKQIGYGQSSNDEYFSDITRILAELYRITKKNGAMWIVLDNLKSSGQTIPLPWEIINRANEVGWKLQDIIVWDKGRSLPWSHNGRFRGVCEFILLFGKGSLNVFDLDAVRDSEHLSSYWVKYPERFHPDGKAPSDLWHFPTPVQGSWSNGRGPARHFCPFPIELVARMVTISTKQNDIVLDPFAGTGSVIATASYLNRYGFGFDVNKIFAKEYEKKGYKSYIEQAKEILPKKKVNNHLLRKLIVKLRMLKFAKSLFSQLTRSDRLNCDARKYIVLFFVRVLNYNNLNAIHLNTLELGNISIDILVSKSANIRELKSVINSILHKPPLSKFGIQVDIQIISANKWNNGNYLTMIGNGPFYLYIAGAFYKFAKTIYKKNIIDTIIKEADSNNKIPSILSNIKADSYLPIDD